MLSLTSRYFADRDIAYDGTQLAPHWLYRTFDVSGDALVAFQGKADVPVGHMVDLEDVKKNAPIFSRRMLHFIGEWFIDSLDYGICLQHFFVAELYESLLERGITTMRRRGNDLYFDGRKLTVSIATRSPVSVLMHTAINIETEGTPVPTAGLRELDIDPATFAVEVMERFTADLAVWRTARVKVLPR